MIYIACCFRSGTIYLQRLMKRYGVSLGQEVIKWQGMVGCPLTMVREKGIVQTLKNHPPMAAVIREPHACISSMCWRTAKLVYRMADVLETRPGGETPWGEKDTDAWKHTVQAQFWLEWNRDMLGTGCPLFRLEDLQDLRVQQKLLDAVGVDKPATIYPYDPASHNAGHPVEELLVDPAVMAQCEDIWRGVSHG